MFLYTGNLVVTKIIYNQFLSKAIQSEMGQPCLPLLLRIALTHFYDLSDYSSAESGQIECEEWDNGTTYSNQMGELVIGLTRDGKMIYRQGDSIKTLDFNYREGMAHSTLHLNILCPDILGERMTLIEGEKVQMRTHPPHVEGSRLIWSIKGTILDYHIIPHSALSIPAAKAGEVIIPKPHKTRSPIHTNNHSHNHSHTTQVLFKDKTQEPCQT